MDHRSTNIVAVYYLHHSAQMNHKMSAATSMPRGLFLVLQFSAASSLMQIVDPPFQPVLGLVYKRFTDSWTVTFPNQFNADVLAPQLCAAPNTSCVVPVNTQHLSCEQLAATLRDPTWHVASSMALDQDPCPGVLQGWQHVEKRTEAQLLLGAPYDNLRALPPSAVDITSSGSFVPPPGPDGSIHVILRITFLTFTGSGYATHQFAHPLMLRAPRDLAGVVLRLQHECSAQGLQSLPLSSLVLSWASGYPACVWQCRPDYIRHPWNSAPPEKQHNITTGHQFCRALPTLFTAIEFEFYITTSLNSPVPAQLSASVLSELDDVSTLLEEALAQHGSKSNIVTAKVPGSMFDDVQFDALVRRHVFVLGQSSSFEILLNQDFSPPVVQRRLLELAHTTLVTCSGLLFSSDITWSPAHFVNVLQASVAAVNAELANRAPGSLLEIRSPQVIRLYRLGLQSKRRRSLLGTTFLDYSLVLGSVLFCIIIAALFCVQRHSAQKNTHATPYMSYAR